MNFIFPESVRILYLFSNVKKQTKQMLNCLKRAETSVVLIVFTVSSVKSALVLLPFIIVAQHESGTRKKLYLGQLRR